MNEFENIVDVLMMGRTMIVLHFLPAASIVSRTMTWSTTGLLAGLKYRCNSCVLPTSKLCIRAKNRSAISSSGSATDGRSGSVPST